jgi:peptide/nickel transport system ATP-binding protein
MNINDEAIYDAEVAHLPDSARPPRPAPAAALAARPVPLVEVRNLSVAFGPADTPPVVRGISFTLYRGECLALVGESGSGKSVTSRTLVGLTGSGARVSADRLVFDDEDLLGYDERRWRALRGRRVGFVMQDALGSLDPLRLVGDEIAETLRLHTGLDRAQRAAKVLELLSSVGIPDPEARARQRPFQLSGGLRQRALIASAIACGPRLLVADEPTTALDAAVQAQVLDLLASLRTADNAMIVVSHDFAVVSRLADTVAVMQHGLIVEHGPVESVLRSPKHPYTRRLLDAVSSVHGRGSRVAVPRSLELAARAPDTAAPLIEARNLRKVFPSPGGSPRVAVDDVSFSLRPGETLGIVGESGSGKTTTLRLVLGLETPDSGSVRLHGRDWLHLPAAERRAARRRMQVVFQDPLASFDPRYTVARVLDEALDFAPRAFAGSAARRARAVELLRLVRLDESHLARRPIELSGGMRQRLAIARALAPEPDILVCDEPVSALDVSIQAQVLDLLAELKTRLRLACLFISHDLGVIHRVSDRVLVMKDGAVVEQGPVSEIFAYPKHTYTRALLSAIPQLDFKAAAIHI